MLPPDSRSILLDQLRPPVGYRLDAAVATSFTLSLAAALVPPLAFASFELRDAADPIAALEAVRSCADRVDIFCQAGQIAIPPQASDLMAFLEPMVHEVTAARSGHLFHPKIWLLKYVADGLEASYRLLCSTRNLALDRSWDAVVRLDGVYSGGRKAVNRPIASLISHTMGQAIIPLTSERVARVEQLAEDARHIDWELPEDVKEVLFHAFGIPGSRSDADFSGYRHLVVSPFLNDAGVVHVTSSTSKVTLVSRPDELEMLSTTTVASLDEVFTLDPVAGLEDPDGAEAVTTAPVVSGLHAKIVVLERNRAAHVFIGSANATSAAFGGNVEFLVELVGGIKRVGVARFLDDDDGLRALLVPYVATGGQPQDPADEQLRQLENAVRNLAARVYTLETTVGSTGFTLSLSSGSSLPIPPGFSGTADLLTVPGRSLTLRPGVARLGDFSDVALPDITPFVALRLTNDQAQTLGTVVRAQLLNDPPGRLDQILARQVDTPEKFLRFLALLLGLADPASLTAPGGQEEGGGAFPRFGTGPGVLELILRALADQPESLLDLDRLVQRLRSTDEGRKILPDGFDQMWPNVVAALARRGEALA